MSDTNPTNAAVSGPTQVQIKSINYVNSPTYSSFYCNNAAFGINQVDIVLLLGEILEVTPAGEAKVERRARVTMSPAQAKALAKILAFGVTAYERTTKRVVEELPVNLPELPPE